MLTGRTFMGGLVFPWSLSWRSNSRAKAPVSHVCPPSCCTLGQVVSALRRGGHTAQNTSTHPAPGSNSFWPSSEPPEGPRPQVALSGPEKGVITKGSFHLRNLWNLKSLNSLESLENGRILLSFPQSESSLESLESLNSLESLENGFF